MGGRRRHGGEKGRLCVRRTKMAICRGLPFGRRNGHWKRMNEKRCVREIWKKEKKRKKDTRVWLLQESLCPPLPFATSIEIKKKKKKERERDE